MLLISISIVVGVLYLFLILAFIIGWNQHYTFEPKGNESVTTKVSVIIACKNEQENIQHLISYIAQQSYQNFELIIVNDHSTDATKFLIKQAIPSFPKIKLLDAVGFGKKNAIKEGILHSTTDFIVTIDADCFPTFHWLESIVCFQKKLPSDLLICPVKISESEDFFLRIQALEFVSLVASGAGAAGIGMPILCNGANLAFTKQAWLNCQAELHEEELSGDDIFLLQSIKKRGGVIRFVKSESALINTKPVTNFTDFIKQRRRWTSKSPAYTDWHIIIVAVLVLSTAVVELTLMYHAISNQRFLIVFGVFFLFKYLLDFKFLSLVQNFFHLKNVGIESVFLSIIYPFYIVFVAFSTFIFKPKTW